MLYLPTGFCPVARGIDDHVGQADLFLLRWLGVYALLGLLEAERSRRHQAFNLLFSQAGRYPQRLADLMPTRLNQFDGFNYHHRRLGQLYPPPDLHTGHRMYDLLQASQLRGIIEHDAP